MDADAPTPQASGEEAPARPPAAAQGDLRRTPLAHLLMYASERHLTGSVELSHPSGRSAAIALVDGRIAKARTSEPVAHLGTILLQRGYVTQEQLDASRATLTEQGGLHGQLLLQRGVITEHQLRDALMVQLVFKVDYIFALPFDTTFEFFDGFDALAAYGGDALSLDVLAVMWRGLCIQPPVEHVEAALSRMEHAHVTAPSSAQLERLCLAPEAMAVAETFRTQAISMREFAAGGGSMSAATARLLLYLFVVTKQVEVVQGLAGVSPAAPADPLHAYRMSLIGGASAPLAYTTKISALSTAQEVASDAPSAARAEPHVEAKPSEPTAAERLAMRREEIVKQAARIDSLDYFQMLGVDPDASPEAVDAAFKELAKVWHPDRVPKELEDLKAESGRVFGRLAEAHHLLVDPAERPRYLKLVKEGGATPEAQEYIARVVEAAMAFQKAEILAKRGEYAQAEPLCRRAYELDATQAGHLALLAWIESTQPQNQSEAATRERISMMDRAIAINGRCERAYFHRGSLYKKLGDMRLAESDFRRALEIAPRSPDAQREVRLFDARKTQEVAPSTKATAPAKTGALTGMLAKLLKKGQ